MLDFSGVLISPATGDWWRGQAASNSALPSGTGNFQGNRAVPGGWDGFSAAKGAPLQWLAPDFPARPNREFVSSRPADRPPAPSLHMSGPALGGVGRDRGRGRANRRTIPGWPFVLGTPAPRPFMPIAGRGAGTSTFSALSHTPNRALHPLRRAIPQTHRSATLCGGRAGRQDDTARHRLHRFAAAHSARPYRGPAGSLSPAAAESGQPPGALMPTRLFSRASPEESLWCQTPGMKERARHPTECFVNRWYVIC